MTKEFLKEHIEKLREAEGLKFEIDQMYQPLKSPVITGMPSGTPANKDKIGEILWKIQEKEIRYLAKLDIILKEEEKIEKIIDSLEDSRQRTVMRYRYISGLEWEEVCVKAHYSWQHTHRLHADALNKLNM